MTKWESEWNDSSIFIDLQLESKCCGWNNYTDRSIVPCPITFVSGCKNGISEFLEPRFRQILIMSCTALTLGLISFVSLLLACSIGGQDDLLAHFDSNAESETEQPT
ncbi:hypothetical protein TVAG_469520 [Trichomonas vaginalis G3]|uniref:Tetraspanin family protein n=1 Tax=Trichomonas vaginalis (strain ATCC PRA-98 / G3) TaxID=412133 RepID=A2GIG2_TRIV3|nr:hypothetical protein TVAG_469520 [Trichomonas vaginalis G3]|eukprot:XP_001295984.1 hypothetical protein [Trichomonas vaginalis G3]